MIEPRTIIAGDRHTRNGLLICVVSLFVLATALRILNITNPPLDYFPLRQLRAAIIARGMYYQQLPSANPATRDLAVSLWHTMEPLEPPIFERLVALTYRLIGGEHLWVARVYSILFWMLGGLAIYALARRMTSPIAAIVTLIYYLFLPWSVIFSRIFQPDLLMVMFTLFAAYTIYRWADTPSWKWAALSGVLSGVAVLVKLPAVFPLAVMFIGIIITTRGVKKAISDPQAWLMGAAFVLIPAIYYLLIIPGSSGAWFSNQVALMRTWVQPSFYIRWIIFAGGLVDLGVAFISFVGVWLLPKKPRMVALALWVGYALYGLAFPWHITTHEYYSIPLIPAIALSLAPLAQAVFSRLNQGSRWMKWTVAGVLVFSIGYSGWISRSILLSKSFRGESAGWKEFSQVLPKDGDLIGITHEMGIRIAYYGWTHVNPWLYDASFEQSLVGVADPRAEYQKTFENATRGQDYFVITLLDELDTQPMLKAYLNENYPIHVQADWYIIYDLTSRPDS